MSRIIFEDQAPTLQPDPGRADVACFVGLARLAGGAAATALSPAVAAWFAQQGWNSGPFARTTADQLALLNLPVPIESYAGFTSLFDPGGSALSCGTDYLAAAVRSFFAQGGRRCYVVRMGDPIGPSDSPATLLSLLAINNPNAADDPRGWRGVTHLGGLPDVSYLLLPDLPVLCSSLPPAHGYDPSAPPSGSEQFVECSVGDITPSQVSTYSAPAPRLTLDDYGTWAKALIGILSYVYTNFREVQVVAAMPLPQVFDISTSAAIADGSMASPADLAEDIQEVILTYMGEKEEDLLPGSLSTAFLQLAYPWLVTTGSTVLMEGLEPPDGVLAGLLARNALTSGAFVSATKTIPAEVIDVWPQLPAHETAVGTAPLAWGQNIAKPLIERLSLFGFTPAGLRLLSDVTAFAGESYRSGPTNRLVSVIVRAARLLGEQLVFASNGENLWARIESSLTQLMLSLWRVNALDAATAQDAFRVRCDRSTMTQNDLDNGRVVAVVAFTAASTIELIRVTLGVIPNMSGQGVSFTLQEVA
jgi:hypothetical protein